MRALSSLDLKCKERLGTKRDPFDLASKKPRHLASGWIRALRMQIHNATDESPPSGPYYLVPKRMLDVAIEELLGGRWIDVMRCIDIALST